MRLLAAGQRPVSNVVDVSNYVMLEPGKPIHTFDAAAVHDRRILVRLARAGERLETLDHLVRELTTDTLIIADPEGPDRHRRGDGRRPVEIGTETRDVVIESAIFDPISIRRTAFRYALRSEASLRFEKGRAPARQLGADRTARLIREWAGGQVAIGAVDTDPAEPAPTLVAFRPLRIDWLTGTTSSAPEQADVRAGSASRQCRHRPARRSWWRRRSSRSRSTRDRDPPRHDPDLAARPRDRGRHRRRDRPRPWARTPSPPSCPTHRCRRTGTRRSRSATSCARRWRGRLPRGRHLRARVACDGRALRPIRRRRSQAKVPPAASG